MAADGGEFGSFRVVASGVPLCFMAAFALDAAEPAWNPAAIKECGRACLVDYMNRYMDAIYKHETKLVPPLALDVQMTENTGQMDVGEGMLWRSKVEPTTFHLIAADPVQGQVSLQSRVKILGRNTLFVVRLKIDRGQILEIEQLWANGINDAAIPLLTTPRKTLVDDIPLAQRLSCEVLLRAANSYFDALECDDGKIAALQTIAYAMRTVIRRSIILRRAAA
jgi:hypothetical protein